MDNLVPFACEDVATVAYYIYLIKKHNKSMSVDYFTYLLSTRFTTECSSYNILCTINLAIVLYG